MGYVENNSVSILPVSFHTQPAHPKHCKCIEPLSPWLVPYRCLPIASPSIGNVYSLSIAVIVWTKIRQAELGSKAI